MAPIIPVREHFEYALLWDLAREMAKLDGRTAEECWLATMDAFWVGKLPELFVFNPRKGGAPGRVLMKFAPRSAIAHLLLGPGRRLPAALRGWTYANYLGQPEPFRTYFARHPQFGLAARRADFDRWCGKPQRGQEEKLAPSLPTAGKEKPKRRPGPTRGELRRFEDADRALFPELKQMMAERHMSRSAAALVLAEAGKILGSGTTKNRAKRLAELYGREKARAE
jgi:hypothetical protein